MPNVEENSCMLCGTTPGQRDRRSAIENIQEYRRRLRLFRSALESGWIGPDTLPSHIRSMCVACQAVVLSARNLTPFEIGERLAEELRASEEIIDKLLHRRTGGRSGGLL